MSKRVYLCTWRVVTDPDLGDVVTPKVKEIIDGGAAYNSVQYSFPEANPATGEPIGSKCIATVDADVHTPFQGVTGIEDITV